MRWSDITFSPSVRVLRQFAGLWGIFVGGLAIWYGLWGGHPLARLVLAALAGSVGLLGLVWPGTVRWVYVTWMVAAFPFGWLISRVVLAVLFFGVFTPLALLFRLTGRDLLQLRRPAARETYWITKPAVADARRYFRPF
jgi:hypothetical protein